MSTSDSELPELEIYLEEYVNPVKHVHILGTLMLIYLLFAAWYHSSRHYAKIKKDEDDTERYNVEPHLRYLLLINMALMCIVFGAVPLTQATDIGRYYRDNNLKSALEVNFDDYPSFNLYLFTFLLQIFAIHHTINVIRIFYELQHSIYTGRKYVAFILFVHSLIYSIVALVSSMNPFVLSYTVIIIDYPQHFVIIGIYCYRMCQCQTDTPLRLKRRRVWGAIAEIFHLICLLPYLYVVLVLDAELQTAQTKILSFVLLYVGGFVNFLGWYQLFMNTPNQFIDSKGKFVQTEEDEDGDKAERRALVL